MLGGFPVKQVKEPFWKSDRTKVFVSTVVLEIVLYVGYIIAATAGIEVPESVLNTIAASIAGVAGTWIWGRTQRNTDVAVLPKPEKDKEQ